MTRINGKDITLKIGDKFFAGLTDVGYDSSAKVEKSLIKEDNGVEQSEIIGFDEKFSISGIVCISETGEATTHEDWAAIRTAYKAKAAVTFAYGMFATGKPEISGNLKILSYSEKTGASGKATYSISAEIIQDDDLTEGTTPA